MVSPAGPTAPHRELAGQLRTARDEGGAFHLPPRLLIRLSGGDAFRYLNGQVTRDLSRLSSGEALPACLLTPKGKLCAPLLIRRETMESLDILIEADPSLKETLPARLERYIVADDVTVSVEPCSPTLHFFGSLAEALPWEKLPGIRVNRLGAPGWDLPSDRLSQLPEKNQPVPLDPRVVETLRIERGIPAWGPEVGEETLPPEVGFDRTHIDYNRGCYPGQEVISRLKSIGRVNRLLVAFTATAGSILRPAMDVIDGEGKKLGTLTSVAEQFDTGSRVALGYLTRAALEATAPLFALDPLTGGKTPLSIMEITAS